MLTATMPDVTNPAEALQLAEAAQARCDHAEAERWGLRAAHLAREDDPLMAYMGRRLAGWSWYERGEDRRALRLLRVAQTTAEAVPDLAERRPRIYYDVCSVASAAGFVRLVGEYHRRAVQLYPVNDPRRLALDNDAAYSRMQAGAYAEAAGVFAALVERLAAPDDALIARSNAAVALAGAGRRAEARAAVRALREELPAATTCGSAWGWLSVGRALHMLGEDERGATAAAATARRLAAARGEERTRAAAAALQAELHGR